MGNGVDGMNTSDNKVVSLELRGAAGERTRAQTLVLECEAVALRYLPALLKSMLDSADDTLFELADKAESNTAQNAYFDAMRELRLKRQALEQGYADVLRQGFQSFLETPATPMADEPVFDADADSMMLVDEADLEESLAVTTMFSKAMTRCARELHAIEHRFGALACGQAVEAEALPMSPKVICEAFRHAMQVFSAETKIKLIVYKLFDNSVIANLSPLYEECNALLADAGVLPKLRMTVKKQPRAAGASKPQLADDSYATPESPTERFLDSYSERRSDSVSATALDTLQQLLGLQQAPLGAPAVDAAPSSGGQEAAAIHTVDLLNALSAIQRRDVRYDAIDSMDELKAILSDEIKTLKEDGKLGLLTPLDNDVIDIVGLLFDFVLDDGDLPAVAKASLSRLQIPMLKVAISDKELFRKKQHPARRLLNLLAKSALGLDESLRPDSCPILQKIDYVVCRILDDFQDDVSLFDTLLEEFERFLSLLHEQEQREQLASQQRYETREQQKLSDAWVTEAIAVRLKDKEIPRAVYELITGPWKEVMVSTYLDEGDNSQAWKEQLRFIDMLIWSVEPKKIHIDKKKLAAIIQQLLGTLHDGLETIATAPEEIERITASLEACHMACLRGEALVDESKVRVRLESGQQTMAAETVEDVEQIAQALDVMQNQLDQMSEMEALLTTPLGETDADGAPLTAEFFEQEVEEITLSDVGATASAAPQIKDEHWRTAQNIQIGQWLRLCDEQGKTQRAKMVWRSELLDECTFLNWKFKVVADLTFSQLAEQFRTGNAALIDDLPLFEKAMDAVMSRLHKNAAAQPA